jgi:two-component sensor histidine kinase
VTSEETRHHLQDAHQRVLSVAAVQLHLHLAKGVDQIESGPYLSKLCESLGASMTGEGQPIEIKVMADKGTIASSKAVSLGLIVTELLINAVKYAFPVERAGALVLVTDNGVGKRAGAETSPKAGLGTAIVQALAKQFDAQMDVVSGPAGTSVSIVRATFTSHMPQAT